MGYKDEIVRSMEWLAEKDNTIAEKNKALAEKDNQTIINAHKAGLDSKQIKKITQHQAKFYKTKLIICSQILKPVFCCR